MSRRAISVMVATVSVLSLVSSPHGGTATAAVRDAGPAPTAVNAAEALVGPPLAPGLEQVPVSSKAYDAATARVEGLQRSIRAAAKAKEEAIASLVLLRQQDVVLTAAINDATSRARLARHRIDGLVSALQELAVANYISGNTTSDGSLDRDLNFERHNELGGQKIVVSIINTDKVKKLRLTRAALDKAKGQIKVATSSRNTVRSSINTAVDVRDQSALDEQRFGGELFLAVKDVEATRHLAMVDGLDFPLVVLDAYVKAAKIMALAQPSCGIEWWAMAGIGLTESRHGTFGGAEVRVDGSLTKPILGIALDGSNNTAVIGGPGGFDRAQGPMQFITSTWAGWGRDGNGDGVKDIQNFYDAAAGAAAYLCAGGPMRTDADLQRGYFSYNHSLTYVVQVLGQARSYQRSLTLPTPP